MNNKRDTVKDTNIFFDKLFFGMFGMFLIIILLIHLTNLSFKLFENSLYKSYVNFDMAISLILSTMVMFLGIICRRVIDGKYRRFAFLIINLILIISIIYISRYYNQIEYPNYINAEYGDYAWQPTTVSKKTIMALYDLQKAVTVIRSIPYIVYLIYIWLNVKKFFLK